MILKTEKKRARRGTVGRLIGTICSFYPVFVPLALFCIIFSAAVGAVPSLFMQKVIAVIEDCVEGGSAWGDVSGAIFRLVLILVVLYVASLAASVAFNQIMATITQGTLKKLRVKMFDRMEILPVKFFDTHNHGDVMSIYTNDIDTLRQLISQSMPQLLMSLITVLTVFGIMIYFCVWMTLVVLAGVAVMFVVTKRVGGGSAKYFVRQQRAIGETEGFAEEMMNGQKVIKVFCHEEASEAAFDRINDRLCAESEKANIYANILGPILNNIGNILYVIVAIAGGLFIVTGIPNVSLSGMPIGISIVVPFLNMTKQFAGNISQVSHQINSVVMGIAGAERIFGLLDEEPEEDDGYVTLVNARCENGVVTKCDERTDTWAWCHPHSDGSVTYTPLMGDVVLDHVDFEYVEGKRVLSDVSLYAKPGQKVAFVGATGAGKTTVTNLLNRFYDIADGKIRYDGINVNKIRKSDLRHALGIVLQDTNLFTGTVMENIRYGKLDATDEECYAASHLAGADDFISRLPEGYSTMLTENGANLSQGQRQLLSIARAAVADPPVMILDEATSSIDTRTEAIVQRGMDALMRGRTVFVIAHRLSTVKNSDVIIVLDHGQIIERGSHDELIAKRGQYYSLYTGAFELE